MGGFFAVTMALSLQPTTCTEMVLITTFMTFLAPHWALTSQVGLGTLAACLTRATFTFVAIVVPGFEGLDLVNGGCHCYSTTNLVPIEVFHHAFMLLGMFKELFICDSFSFLLLPYLFLDLKVFGHVKTKNQNWRISAKTNSGASTGHLTWWSAAL